MTEGELMRLPLTERQKIPFDVMNRIGATTREEGREILTTEGWTFVAIDDSAKEDPERYDPEADDVEIWFRQIPGGPPEWCELWCNITLHDLVPDRAWQRVHSPIDPRLIEV